MKRLDGRYSGALHQAAAAGAAVTSGSAVAAR